MSDSGKWWRRRDLLEQYIGDLVAGELARLRPGAVLPPRPWATDESLVEGSLACDSLELLSLAAALAEALGMHRAGLEDYLLARRSLADWRETAAAGLERYCAELSFRSSGSTGAPKTVHHPLLQLYEEVDVFAGLFRDRSRILCAVPSHHIYGFLFGILLPQQCSLTVLDIRDRSPAGVRAVLRSGDLVVGHPVFWDAFARVVDDVPADITGLTSTAPCPADTAHRTRAAGIARLVEIYGSSETAGVGWRDDPDAGFALLPHWRAGTGPSRLIRASKDNAGVEVELPDRLIWLDDRRFRVDGRRDEAVQVGGINVFPSKVRATLIEHGKVRDAAVRLMHPHEGNRLKAFIVPTDTTVDPRELGAELTAWCNERLSTAERPKAFAVGAELPRTALGKAADWPLSDA